MKKEEIQQLLGLLLPQIQQYIDKKCLENTKVAVKIITKKLNEQKTVPLQPKKSFEQKLTEELFGEKSIEDNPEFSESNFQETFPQQQNPNNLQLNSSPRFKQMHLVEQYEKTNWTEFLNKVDAKEKAG